MQALVLILVGLVSNTVCIHKEFQGFDDSILFSINWPGADESLSDEPLVVAPSDDTQKTKEVLTVKTSNKEVYNCHLPNIITNEPVNIKDYDGPSSIELLKPLFTQKICSYRLESYWSYEVCHGRYIRQYHEERDGKNIKIQEYFLGYWTPEKQKVLEEQLLASKEKQEKPKLTKLHGVPLPSVEMVFDDGTICDLSGKPRLTRVQYVCYVSGKHEVFSFKETSTCEYEIIVLSPFLCEHPQFKPHEATENVISCLPVDGAPMKPKSLLAMEAETLQSQLQPALHLTGKENKDVIAVFKVEKTAKDGETRLKLELRSLEDFQNEMGREPPLAESPARLLHEATIADDSPVRAFLNGETCLTGGTGWWKYEFCYGRSVSQYHTDRGGERTTVLLGKYDEDAHLHWIQQNKNKAPKPLDIRTSISHLYSNGDICDKTGKRRQTEVKLKCLENSSNAAQVSLYLLEPRTCHYILGVESPLICDILPLADENGLISLPKQKTVLEKTVEIDAFNEVDMERDDAHVGQ